MRRVPKLDSTHRAVVQALRAVGCDVLSLAGCGSGVPDLLVHRAGRLWLMEVKRPAGPRGGDSEHGQRLGEAQVAFARRWPVCVARSADEAMRAVGAVESRPAAQPDGGSDE